MRLSYIQGNAGLLIEAQIDYLTKKYGEQVDQELIQHAIATAHTHGNLGVAEKLLFGYVNNIIDKISLSGIEQVKDLDPNKKKTEKPEVVLARSLMSKKSQWITKVQHPQTPLNEVVDYVLGLYAHDPTRERREYSKYIVAQLRMDNITLPADGGRLYQALKFFHDNKNTQRWKELGLPVDLMGKESKISNWRHLEEIYRELNPEEGEAVDFTSKRQQDRGLKEGYQMVAEIEVPNKYKTLYTIYKITEPEAAQFLGKGTHWCTAGLHNNVPMLPPEATNHTGEPNPDYSPGYSAIEPPYTFTYADWHPKAGETREYKWMQGPKTGKAAGKEGFPITAQNEYLKRAPLYIIFRKHQEGGPESRVRLPSGREVKTYTTGRSGQLFQIGEGSRGLEIMNVQDDSLSTISPSLDYVFAKWAESDPDAPMEWIRTMRNGGTGFLQGCRKTDYAGRPPVI
jgi:hypothetical protein